MLQCGPVYRRLSTVGGLWYDPRVPVGGMA
jgi:hypothetical protein